MEMIKDVNGKPNDNKNKETGKVSRDPSISLIRVIATIFIVSCHMMQYLDSVYAWWFNVGVQVFLIMSGYLYGQRRDLGDSFAFVKKQFGKILLDYLIVVIPMFLIHFFFNRENITFGRCMSALLTYGTLEGGEHLWYIPYILFCYFLAPFLSGMLERLLRKSAFWNIVSMILICLVIEALGEKVFTYFNPAWINCFVVGMYLGKLSVREDKRSLYIGSVIFICLAAIVCNAVQIRKDYFIPKLTLHWIIESYYWRFQNYNHLLLGALVFFGLKALFSLLFRKGTPSWLHKVCRFTDKYSYDVYLVHQFLILGSFSLMRLTASLTLNIVIIWAIVLIWALVIYLAARWIEKHCKSRTM